MAQTYQMKHNPQGTIYSLLTVESDGQMTMTFHGTDREISHEANVTEDGRIATGGSLFPGLESGKWNKMDDVRCMMADGRCMMADEPLTMNPEPLTMNHEPLTINPEPLTVNHSCRQRKQRKPRVERQEPDISLSPCPSPKGEGSSQPSDISHQTSSTMKAIGMVAAVTVALFVIYETGLLIPMGLIGLATGGLLK